MLPFIGHTGVCGSNGMIYDFGGDEYVAKNNMTFGSPYKYLKLDIKPNEY